MGVRWKKIGGGIEGENAFSGDLDIGHVLRRSAEPRVWVYSLTAVHTKWITKGHGEVSSLAAGKRAMERAWAAWLAHAGLEVRG